MRDEEEDQLGAFRGVIIWFFPALAVWGLIIWGVKELLK